MFCIAFTSGSWLIGYEGQVITSASMWFIPGHVYNRVACVCINTPNSNSELSSALSTTTTTITTIHLYIAQWPVPSRLLVNPLEVSDSTFVSPLLLTASLGKAPRKQLAAKSSARKTAVSCIWSLRCPLLTMLCRPQLVVWRSLIDSGLELSLFVKSDVTRSRPSCLSANFHSNDLFERLLRISRCVNCFIVDSHSLTVIVFRLIFASNLLPSWLFRKPPRLTSSRFSKIPILLLFTLNVSPSNPKIWLWLVDLEASGHERVSGLRLLYHYYIVLCLIWLTFVLR